MRSLYPVSIRCARIFLPLYLGALRCRQFRYFAMGLLAPGPRAPINTSMLPTISDIFQDVTDTRRRNMAAVHGKDTKPELIVRRLLHKMGYRYRLHSQHLAGKPDIVFASRRKIIEVQGCFWHRHPGCQFASTPATRKDFWQQKFDQNVRRDSRNRVALAQSGWSVLIIWGCEVRAPELRTRLQTFLGPPGATQPYRSDRC